MDDILTYHSDPDAAVSDRNRSIVCIAQNVRAALQSSCERPRQQDDCLMLRKSAQCLLRLHERSTEQLGEQMDAGLKCDIGVNRLAVSADGGLYPCERFWCSSAEYRIGDVANGFDIESILRIRSKVLESSADRCRSCWAQRLCSECLLAACGDDLAGPKRDTTCEGIQREVEHHLRLYYEICRGYPEAIDRLESLL